LNQSGPISAGIAIAIGVELILGRGEMNVNAELAGSRVMTAISAQCVVWMTRKQPTRHASGLKFLTVTNSTIQAVKEDFMLPKRPCEPFNAPFSSLAKLSSPM